MRKRWSLALLLLACSDTDSREGRFVAKLRDCDLLSEGKFHAQIDKDESCPLNCFTAASCRDVEATVCDLETATSRAYESCLEKCGYDVDDSFECEDGSSEEASRCDAEPDCDDGSNEQDCPASAFFVCEDGDRILKGYICDGEDDCADGEDEESCERHPGFRCKDGDFVVGEELECDSYEDCDDGSDELKCAERGLLFECDDGSEVSKSRVCDGHDDCEDGSDEEQGCAHFQCGG